MTRLMQWAVGFVGPVVPVGRRGAAMFILDLGAWEVLVPRVCCQSRHQSPILVVRSSQRRLSGVVPLLWLGTVG
jgi:hypothetical protein